MGNCQNKEDIEVAYNKDELLYIITTRTIGDNKSIRKVKIDGMFKNGKRIKETFNRKNRSQDLKIFDFSSC